MLKDWLLFQNLAYKTLDNIDLSSNVFRLVRFDNWSQEVNRRL